MISEKVYRVQRVNGRQRMVVHYNRLKDANQEQSAAEEPPSERALGQKSNRVTKTAQDVNVNIGGTSANTRNLVEK